MNIRQKLSLAALCFTIPAMASAQAAAPAPAAEPAAAPAAAPAPAFEFKAYGFLALTYVQSDASFKYPEYASVPTAEDVKTNVLSARQSRIGWTMKNADGGFLGTKALTGRLEFDFMGSPASTAADQTCTNSAAGETCTVSTAKVTTTTSWDSVMPRLRYAVAKADWAAGPGTFSVSAGQTDGLVNPLHPELGAYLALPTFMQSGNLTRRSPQIRAGYDIKASDMVAVTVEAAALSGAGAWPNAGNASGRPDIEARLQAVVKPMADVTATVGVGYHNGKQSYDVDKATEANIDTSLIGVDVNVDATKYLNVRGEWFTGKGTDPVYTGAFGATTGTGAAREANETSGFWAQATIKPIPQAWIIAGFGSSTQKSVTTADDTVVSMMNVGVLSPVSKNWRLGLEYTTSKIDTGVTASTFEGSQFALSSRFSF